ncbi:MAG: hypothetical protein AAF601_08900 [Pseudomonadota bacterium]
MVKARDFFFCVCLMILSLPAHARGECILAENCAGSEACELHDLTLAWDREDALEVNGVWLATRKISSGTHGQSRRTMSGTYKMVFRQDMIIANNANVQVGIVRGASDPEVIATMFQVPRRYVEYTDAIAGRRVFSGPCEGLF